MHLVFLNQYYPPDAAPTGTMLERVVEELVKAGHGVTVICAKGGYANRERGGADHQGSGEKIIRVGATSFGRRSFLGKLADYGSFYVGVAWALARLGQRPDRIIALTTPPYLSILARIFSRLHRAEHAHWVMDLYPDVMEAHGMLRKGGMLHRLLRTLTRWGFGGDRCACVLSLGPDMSRRVQYYLEDGKESEWVPLWSNSTSDAPAEEEVNRLRTARGWRDDELVVMYSGNMGLGHLFDEILAVAEHDSAQRGEDAGGSHRRFVFYGGGKRRVEMERFIEKYPDSPVELHDYVEGKDLRAHLASADVHLVSLRPEWDGTMVPSKLQGVFAVSRPVIFIGSADSSIGQWVSESGGGWVVGPGDEEALQSAIHEACDPDERSRRGQLAGEYGMGYFESTRNASQVADLLSR